MKIFIASKLKNEEQRALNEQLAALCEEVGFEVLLPQRLLPLDTQKTAVEILESNEHFVGTADCILAVFDRAESGVAMELGRAHLLQKPIIGFRTPTSIENEDMGKMLHGFWERLPEHRKATNFEELKGRLRQLLA